MLPICLDPVCSGCYVSCWGTTVVQILGDCLNERWLFIVNLSTEAFSFPYTLKCWFILLLNVWYFIVMEQYEIMMEQSRRLWNTPNQIRFWLERTKHNCKEGEIVHKMLLEPEVMIKKSMEYLKIGGHLCLGRKVWKSCVKPVLSCV